MKIQIPRKIRSEDFKPEDQELIGKIGDVYNQFSDEVYNALNKRIDYENLNRQLVDLNVSIDSTGLITSQPQIKTTVVGKVRGILVINAINLINPATYPTSQPFVSFTINGNILTVLNVSGLPNNSEYRLTLELIA